MRSMKLLNRIATALLSATAASAQFSDECIAATNTLQSSPKYSPATDACPQGMQPPMEELLAGMMSGDNESFPDSVTFDYSICDPEFTETMENGCEAAGGESFVYGTFSLLMIYNSRSQKYRLDMFI